MTTFADLAGISALPIVDLANIRAPEPGLLVKPPICCDRNFAESEKCRRHYEQLSENTALNCCAQCPFGLSSYRTIIAGHSVAFTSFVPSPRLGGPKERQVAKSYPGVKFPAESLPRVAKALSDFDIRLDHAEKNVLQQQSMALHEIRKLNREVKQNAERLCQQASPTDPDNADSRLVNIWKAADLMSGQFESLELLANEQLTDLPPNKPCEVYRIFDKCARIYNRGGGSWRISIAAPQGFNARIMACDKTFPIIATVLIENALKYSISNSEITISLDYGAAGNLCMISVTNSVNPMLIPDNVRIDKSVFNKGKRIATSGEGSGNGLYLAKLITDQHGGQIYVSERHDAGARLVTFTVALPTIKNLAS